MVSILHSTYNENYNAEELFFFPLLNDPEADTVYASNHGFAPGTNATVTTSSGSNIVTRTDTSTSL